MLTEKEIYDRQTIAAQHIFVSLVNVGDYKAADTLFSFTGKKKSVILKNIRKDRILANDTIDNLIYYEMVNSVFEDMDDGSNKDMHKKIKSYLEEKFPFIKKEVEDYEQECLQNPCLRANDLSELFWSKLEEKSNVSTKNETICSSLKNEAVFSTYMYLYMGSAIINESGQLDKLAEIMTPVVITQKKHVGLIYKEQIFKDKTDLFGTKQYSKWLQARKTGLCDYISSLAETRINEHNLGKAIKEIYDLSSLTYEKLHLQTEVDMEKLKTEVYGNHPLNPNFNCKKILKKAGISSGDKYISLNMPKWMLRSQAMEQGISLSWLENVDTDNINMDTLIDNYYKNCVARENLIYCSRNEENMSKIYLSRDFKTNPEEDLIGIGYSYVLSIMAESGINIMERYINTEISDKKPHNSVEEDVKKIMKKKIDELEDQNQRFRKTLESLKTDKKKKKTEENKEKRVKELLKENADIKKEASMAEKENERLREKIREMEEYISAISSTETEEAKIRADMDVDMDYLRSKRFIFVGHEEFPIMRELRKQFPSCKIVGNVTNNINNYKADSVVVLIRCVSHSIYHKVTGRFKSQGIPIIMVNSNNIDSICTAMESTLNPEKYKYKRNITYVGKIN